jgi:hypothetical protein
MTRIAQELDERLQRLDP